MSAIRRLLQRVFRSPSPSAQLIEGVRRGQLEAEADRYRRLLEGAAEAHGIELLPWQVDVAVQAHRQRLLGGPNAPRWCYRCRVAHIPGRHTFDRGPDA